jgi:RHS repeat-associated protein
VAWYEADVVTANDYYPFGMIMPGRKYAFDDTYRYGFNGKENDNEVKGEGGQQDYGMRIYDPRLGRFLSVDPLTRDYPWYTPYQFAGNKPVWAIDLDGLEELLSNKRFVDEAAKLGVTGNKRIGELFERIAVAALTGRSVTTFANSNLNYYSQARADRNRRGGPTQVRPDMVGFTFDISDIGTSKTDIRFGANQFFEVKITSATITRGYRKGQIEGMIDVLSEQAKKNKSKAAEFVLVTTEDFKINGDILTYAYKKGVSISIIMAGIDESGLIYFSELRQMQPAKGHSGIIEKIKGIGKGIFGSGNAFEGHSGFDMKDFIYGISNKEIGVDHNSDTVKDPITGAKDPISGQSDPDPIEVDDR